MEYFWQCVEYLMRKCLEDFSISWPNPSKTWTIFIYLGNTCRAKLFSLNLYYLFFLAGRPNFKLIDLVKINFTSRA